MRLLRAIVVLMAALFLALVVGMIASGAYQQMRYPGARETDGLFDVGFVFLLAFLAAAVAKLVTWLVFSRRRR